MRATPRGGAAGGWLLLGHAGADPGTARCGARPSGRSGDDDKPEPACRDHGKHAEPIEITFDPAVTGFRAILEYFFQIHPPSTKGR